LAPPVPGMVNTKSTAKVPSLPKLTFSFGGKPYSLKGSDYVLDVQGTCISSFTNHGHGHQLAWRFIVDFWYVIYLLSSLRLIKCLQVMCSFADTTRFTTSVATLLVSPRLFRAPTQSDTKTELLCIPQRWRRCFFVRFETLRLRLLGYPHASFPDVIISC
jgi:hypothetical protein